MSRTIKNVEKRKQLDGSLDIIGKAGAALCVRIALRGAGAEAALRVALHSNAGAGLRVCEHRVRVVLLHGTAGDGAALRIRVHQHGMWLAVEGLCARTCIQFPQRGRAFWSKNSDKFWGSPCASECVSSFSTPGRIF